MLKKPGPKKGTVLKGTQPYIFGQQLVRIRKRKGLSQRELARKMGTSQRMISYYERQMGNPSMSTIEKLAQALGVSKEAILKTEKGVSGQEFIAHSRLLQQVWPLAAQLPYQEQQVIAKMIKSLAGQNGITSTVTH
jgi:transcriptional regulator with XRE-family HTH domain